MVFASVLLGGVLGALLLPPAADAADTTPPSSNASSSATSSSTSIRVDYTASDGSGSGLATVELWARAPNALQYRKFETDPGPRASGYFYYTPSAGNGTYRFYTIAKDNAGNTEAVPADADTATQVEADPDPHNGKIVFTSFRDGNGEIYTVNPDGTGLTRLTNTAADEATPGWSPDGQRIVFLSGRTPAGIYSMKADGTKEIYLGQSGGDPAWSPDGSRIAFSGDGIYTMKPDGTGVVQVIPNTPPEPESGYYASVSDPAWTPSGELTTTDTQCQPYREWIPPPWGCASSISGITHNRRGSGINDSHPDWSPDGRKVAFFRSDGNEGGTSSGYTAYADGTKLTPRGGLTPSKGRDPAWSPDGTKLAVSGVAVVNADGTGSSTLEEGSDPDWQPVFAPSLDRDLDGIPNGRDNCILDFNTGQEDGDGDGQGNACDQDRDDDGLTNGRDNCPDSANADQADADQDGRGDACEIDVGVLTQSVDATGCISETGSAGACGDGRALGRPFSVAGSPDGANFYVASFASNAVTVFSRRSGRLTQLAGKAGCVSETGSGGVCADGRALIQPRSVAVSRDGKNVYVASGLSDAVAVFSRDTTTGQLTQLPGVAGCISETGSNGSCTDGRALDEPRVVAVDPTDPQHVYVGSTSSDAVAILQRNTTTGGLSQLSTRLGCISDTGATGPCVWERGPLDAPVSLTVSNDGKNLYVAANGSDAVVAFERGSNGTLNQSVGCISETGSEPCVPGDGLDGPFSLAASPGEGTTSRYDRHVYVVSEVSDAVSILGRGLEHGRLYFVSCISETGSNGTCGHGKALGNPRSVAVSRYHVYVASANSDAVAAFVRDPSTGALTQATDSTGCASETGSAGSCGDVIGLDGARSLILSGGRIYVASEVSGALTTLRADLTQPGGPAGCVSETGTGAECGDGKALDGAFSLATTPDGKNVYVASTASNAVAVFRRNATTGQLTQLAGTAGCVSDTGSGGICTDGKSLVGPRSVAVSPDGKSVYVTSATSDAIAVFGRNTTTGQLTQLGGVAGCISGTGSGGACADGRALDGARAVAVSSDGENVYVASQQANAVAIFRRDLTTGELTQLVGPTGKEGCISETGSASACNDGKALGNPFSVAVSADGTSVYVASVTSDALAIFGRNATTGALTQVAGPAGCVSETGTGGTCANGRALDGARSVALSPDGKSIYVASEASDAVALLTRNTTTGALTQPVGLAGCVSEDGSGAVCADGTALNGPFSVAVSPDDKSVYIASATSGGVAVFGRNTESGELEQLWATGGCVSEDGTGGSCADARALGLASSVTVSEDGKNVYTASPSSDAVAVFARKLPAP
jgi:6-phosphogluconolactonase (cycloisomerase 2 family)